MARASWIPLAIGGVGSVLLISGIQGESLASVLKGEFGKEKGKPFGASEKKQTAFTSFTGASSSPESFTSSVPSIPSRPSGPVAPPPGGRLLLEQVERELEKYQKRPLTAKQKMELRQLQIEGQL